MQIHEFAVRTVTAQQTRYTHQPDSDFLSSTWAGCVVASKPARVILFKCWVAQP